MRFFEKYYPTFTRWARDVRDWLVKEGWLRSWFPQNRGEEGIALIATMMVLVLFSILIVYIGNGAISVLRTATIEERSVKAFYAAEAGAEVALAQIQVALQDGYFSDEEVTFITPPSGVAGLEEFTYDQWEVRKKGDVEIETLTDGEYAGLYALTQRVEVTSGVVDVTFASDAVVVSAKAQSIPIFQFGVFFEGDLEATNGPPMTFAGRVHSNGNIYLSSDNAWYEDLITTPNFVYHNRKDFDDQEFGVYIDDESGIPVQLTFDSRSIPGAEAFKAESCLKFDCRLMTGAFNVDSLSVPLPEGMTAYELLRPQEADDTEQEKRAKYAWKADLYVNPKVNELTTASICELVPAVMAMVPQCDDVIRFTWEAFYDGREGHYVDVMEIDADKLPTTINVLYVHFEPDWVGIDAQGDGVHPVVRVKNGVKLVVPLTIVTDNPLYVQGNYNLNEWKPAALVADAVTILSEGWSDSNPPMSGASETYVNVAIMAGMVATPCDWQEVTCIADGTTTYYQDWYSGGIENFPRFIENWGGVTLHFRGSLVSLFESQVATGTWNGSYYGAPIRDWGFDTNFEDPSNLPPGTPNVGYVFQQSQRPLY